MNLQENSGLQVQSEGTGWGFLKGFWEQLFGVVAFWGLGIIPRPRGSWSSETRM